MKMHPFDTKIEEIYQFLLRNRSYNTTIQRGFYSEALALYDKPEDKLISLLYKIQATQSQPKLDNVAAFWRMYNKNLPASFEGLINTVGRKELSYWDLFKGMEQQASWGPKVSSLFTKAIYHIHCDKRYLDLKFLSDAPGLKDSDKLYVPVDRVIIHFFRHIKFQKAYTFANINKYLQERYKGAEMEVWDDLWFWGFVGQEGSGERIAKWNESKFWAIPYADKTKMEEVKVLVNEFIGLIGN